MRFGRQKCGSEHFQSEGKCRVSGSMPCNLLLINWPLFLLGATPGPATPPEAARFPSLVSLSLESHLHAEGYQHLSSCLAWTSRLEVVRNREGIQSVLWVPTRLCGFHVFLLESMSSLPSWLLVWWSICSNFRLVNRFRAVGLSAGSYDGIKSNPLTLYHSAVWLFFLNPNWYAGACLFFQTRSLCSGPKLLASNKVILDQMLRVPCCSQQNVRDSRAPQASHSATAPGLGLCLCRCFFPRMNQTCSS